MPAGRLLDSPEALATRYDVALLDLDGVVYVGEHAVAGAAAALASARQLGMRLAFVTNNAARPPSAVAAHLSELGVPTDAGEVITSAQAAAHHLAERLAPGSKVLVIGTTGLVEALRERGLEPVWDAGDQPQAVVQGYSPDTNWRMLAEGAVAIRRGVPWVATNLDATVPSARGPLPGNGSLVAALRHATGATPTSTGKPDPTMHRETVERSGAQRPLVVGDRLDTDIEGAHAVGCASMLVLTGVTSAAELLAAPSRQQPSYVAGDLHGLLHSHRAPEVAGHVITCGGWSVRPGTTLLLASAGAPDRDATRTGATRTGATRTGATRTDVTPAASIDALRSLCVAAWRTGVLGCAAGDEQAEQVLHELGL